MTKCSGCGVSLQTIDPNKEGYVKENKNICERCFRIQNYNDYKPVNKNNRKYVNILKKINETGELVILVVDIFNLTKNISLFSKYLKGDILLVITKRDIIPKSVNDLKILNYIEIPDLNIIDKIIISSKKNYNFDKLIETIRKYQKNKTVYVVGYTNAGKSTMINKIIKNYSVNYQNLTTSILPSTTMDSIEIPIDVNLTLIDTPGIIDKSNISNYIDSKDLKKILPRRELKPSTYQIKVRQTIIVENLLRIDCESENSLTLYISNELIIDRYFKETDKLKNLEKHILNVGANSDIVIDGLGFIKVVNSAKIVIYTVHKTGVFVRSNLI